MNQTVGNRRTGLVIAERDSRDLADAVITLAIDDELAVPLGEAADQVARNESDVKPLPGSSRISTSPSSTARLSRSREIGISD